MTKPKDKLVRFTPVAVKSIRDAGTQAARTGDSLASIANYMAANCSKNKDGKGFPDYIGDTERAEFKDGVFVHYQTVRAAQYYVREGSNLVPCAKPAKFGPEHEVIDVSRTTGMTPNDFGKLKTSDRSLYDIVAEYRGACNVYAGNRLRMVIGCYKAMHSVPHARGANKSFHDGMLEEFAKRQKALAKRRKDGDLTCPSDATFKRAEKAFWAEIKKGDKEATAS